MIHGGGHIISTRRDIRPAQTAQLLRLGFLPVSIEYRLCPELTLLDGPMRDVCDALKWARKTLPTLSLDRTDIQVDGDRVVAVGWSTGGHLAMTLGWTAAAMNIRPPEAVLAFYAPTDYEDAFWSRPNLPFGQTPTHGLDVHKGLHPQPLAGYTMPAQLHALGGWMSMDDPRSRIILHMNWEAQTVSILTGGLGRMGVTKPTPPCTRQVQSISPAAQIRAGRYHTPTFLIHGDLDDLVPWQQSQTTYKVLCEMGVPAHLVVLKDALHLFDTYRNFKRDKLALEAIDKGFAFLCMHVTVADSNQQFSGIS